MKLLIGLVCAGLCWGQAAVGASRIRYSRLANHWAIKSYGLKFAYQFDEGSGTSLTDYSGFGNTGTLAGGGAAPAWVADGLLYDGGDTTSRTTIDTWSGTSDMTMTAALRPDTIGVSNRVAVGFGAAANGRLDAIGTHSAGRAYYSGQNNTVYGNTGLSANNWYGIGATRTSANARTVFLSGRQDPPFTITATNTPNVLQQGLYTGGVVSGASWVGRIGLAHGWNRILADADILRHYRVYVRVMARRGVTLP